MKIHNTLIYPRTTAPPLPPPPPHPPPHRLLTVPPPPLPGCVVCSTERSFAVAKGAEWSEERRAQLTDLTAEVLRSREWASASVKQYNWSVKGVAPGSGSLHPLMKVRHQVRSILLEMGFEEMPTNNYVESSFWNFDALFQPQQHPARDSHDTFFLRSPARCRLLPEEYLARVKAMHERGGEGSIGYRYDWKREEAEKNILRTHTTAVSSRMLYALAGQSPFVPRKYFSIDRVFRNETLDATHLAEFHQVEGLIADRHLSLGDLLGTIEYFFRRIGISDVKFKPAYNPYTEPSMEIFGYSPQLGKWIEVGVRSSPHALRTAQHTRSAVRPRRWFLTADALARAQNSGMFRPEMLRPMGLPEDVRVIAWGLGLERPTMIKYGIRNIRDLFGPKVKLDVIQSQPIARFDD